MLGWCREQPLFPSELLAIPQLQQALPALDRHFWELISGRFSSTSDSWLTVSPWSSLGITHVEREAGWAGARRPLAHKLGVFWRPQPRPWGTANSWNCGHICTSLRLPGGCVPGEGFILPERLILQSFEQKPFVGVTCGPSRGGQQAESPGAGRMLRSLRHQLPIPVHPGQLMPAGSCVGFQGRTSSFSGSLGISGVQEHPGGRAGSITGSLGISVVCGAAVASSVPLEGPKRGQI